MSEKGAFDEYQMGPVEHIKTAERLAEICTAGRMLDSPMGQVYATAALAHATIAQAQLQEARRLL